MFKLDKGEGAPTARWLGAMAGLLLAGAAFGEVNTRMEFQVSPALAETWSSSIDAKPGQSVDIRLRVSYIGSQSPLGIGAMMYQPTVSNWDSTGPNRDTLAPVANGYGDGVGSGFTPYGSVPDAPGQYGRIFGLARAANGLTPTDPNRYMGHEQVRNGTSYLRIARANVTNWWAGAASPTGSGGVETAQWTPGFRPDTAQPFDTRLTDVVIFKFNITLSADTDLRSLEVTIPPELYSYWDPGFTQARARWVANTTEVSGSIQGEYVTVPAMINVVPAPGALGVMLGAASIAVRRRRRL